MNRQTTYRNFQHYKELSLTIGAKNFQQRTKHVFGWCHAMYLSNLGCDHYQSHLQD